MELLAQDLHDLGHLVDAVPLARKNTELLETNFNHVLYSVACSFTPHVIVE